MRQLQGMDSSFVALEQPNTPMHIGSILIYDPSTAPGGFVRFKDILDFFRSRMSLSQTIRQRLVKVPLNLDYPYWVEDPDFDLEYHVRHIALPKPGDWRQLCIQAARIFARPLDLSRPPWEFCVIEGLDNVEGVPKGSYAMITKVHHAAIDGMSGIDLMDAMHTLTPDAPPPEKPDEWKADRMPDPLGLMFKGYIRAWTNPLRQTSLLAKSAPGVYRAIKGLVQDEFALEPAMSAPRTRFNVPVSSNRVVEGQSFSLKEIKKLRALTPGCKINDVFLAIIGGALRMYLESKDDLPDKSLTTMAPISVRSEEEKNSMGNQVAAMVVPLGTHIADPVERLHYVYDETKRSKAMTNAIGARQMADISKVSPALFMSLGARAYSQLGLANYVKPPFSTIVTNVPGPPVPIYSSGAKMVSMHGLLCLTDGLALGHVVQSYCDQASIAFTACRKAMPDPEFYTECLRQSYEEMMAALPDEESAQAKPKTAKSRSKTAATRKPRTRKQAATG
ncbi:WS/DGAT/MGAT family O-acyltransferase [Alterisphingorhabdus coralli]|uniref:diacylglycerol O-acyltransferase n=1 Tax=Alterisphingorhabdus coralli TaxID=3071408 RepID=A0AA97F663_9SPHN|nr:wax ester/triacylglycerol synthase family O-acyltransferase [Parasphingorhabdus sp. SCSIO 66989]WOE74181.1 wax ester/triacylglycerol synthase family O-acyltransferase [Parasphingorhabdus sp. SCSIO 66989]